MNDIQLNGRWKAIMMTYLPNEEDQDDGGFHDAGDGLSRDPETNDFIELKQDQSYKGFYDFADREGTWKIHGDKISLVEKYDEHQLSCRGGLLVLHRFDEEHGRKYEILFEKEGATGERKNKLSKKTEKKIEQLWDLICECDCIDPKNWQSILAEGPIVLEKLQSHFILDHCIKVEDYDKAAELIQLGYDPNLFEDKHPLAILQDREGEEARKLESLLIEKGADRD